MMKFKSLFRRGQPSHASHQKQHRQRQNAPQQQVGAINQQSSIEIKPRRSASDATVAWIPSSSKSNGPQGSTSIVTTSASPSSKISTSRVNLQPSEYVIKIQELERECESLRNEKVRLEANLRNAINCSDTRRYDDRDAEITQLKEQHSLELDRLAKENELLKNRLRDVVHSPLSDTEKQQLLDATRLHNSAPASIQVLQEDHMNQENATSTTPDWDKRSSSSEVSVACLQDRILQMEETHYSTNEELQATIQELSDLQAQLNELQADNDRLAEEKGVLLESLCRQTEKLEDSRTKVDTLQELLLRDEQIQESKGYNTEREQKLVDLLKSAQEERESLLLKQEELTAEAKSLRAKNDACTAEVECLTKRVKFLDSTIEAANVDRKLIDLELVQAKQEAANRNIDLNRLATLLENARAKIEELEHSRQVENKSEADELLDAARREKDTLETQAAALQEQLARSHCDHDRLQDQYCQLKEEFKTVRKNAESAIKELEIKLKQLKEERETVNTELALVRDSLSELQAQCQRHIEDKREMKALLSDLQRREREAQTKQYELECALAEEKKLRQEENNEWKQFQTDLLMTVRVANDFKTEAQSELERVVLENKTQRDKLRALEAQLDKLSSNTQKNVQSPVSKIATTPTETQQSVITSVQQEMAARRKANITRQDSRLSVKCLIESIENATKQAKAGPGSRSSSTSSLSSGGTNDVIPLKTPFKDQQINNLICTTNSTNNNNKTQSSITKKNYGETKSSVPGQILDSSTLSAKTIDFVKRSSVTDLVDRKDPLCGLVKNGGSRRNALLKWCQNKTIGYRNIDITNFSSSWNDGLALCAILHTYLPDKIPYDSLNMNEKRRNFSIAFAAAESVGIPTTLNIGDMCQLERPDWQQVMSYVTSIYKHFET